MSDELNKNSDLSVKFKVIGIGEADSNAINHMIQQNMTGVDFIVADTDVQVIEGSQAEDHLQLNAEEKHQIPKEWSALEKNVLRELLVGTDILFITADMGGEIGSKYAPLIAKTAKDMGILSIAIVSKPFNFENQYRMEQAEKGIQELYEATDTSIVIPEKKLTVDVNKNTGLREFFPEVNNIAYQTVSCIYDLIVDSGYINVDFEGIRSIMVQEQSGAMIGIGRSRGENRASVAIKQAISFDFFEGANIQSARAILINIMGNESVGLHEIDEAVSTIAVLVDEDVEIIFACIQQSNMKDELSITVIATGLPLVKKEP